MRRNIASRCFGICLSCYWWWLMYFLRIPFHAGGHWTGAFVADRAGTGRAVRKKLLFTIVPAGLLILLLAFYSPILRRDIIFCCSLVRWWMRCLEPPMPSRYGVDSTSLANSASYRDAPAGYFHGGLAGTLAGAGLRISFLWYIPGGATIHSIDNFYVANYIRYGYPDWWSTDC